MRTLATLAMAFASSFALLAQSTSPLISEVSHAIVQQTNDFRTKYELPALAINDPLIKAAEDFAAYMAQTGKYGHQADGRTPAQRAHAAGYNYCTVRENIAYRTNTGKITAESLIEVFVQGWIDSPSHRNNMLADNVTETGVAVATADDTTYYAVQLIGRPKSEQLTIKVRNDSNSTHKLLIGTDESSHEKELAPRVVLTISRCLPTTLRLAGSSEAITIDESAETVITDKGLRQVEP